MWADAGESSLRGRSVGRSRLPTVPAEPIADGLLVDPSAALAVPTARPPPRLASPWRGVVAASDLREVGGTVGGGYGTACSSAAASPRGDPPLHPQRRALEVALSSVAAHHELKSVSPAPLTARRRLPQEVEQMVATLDQRVTQVAQAESTRMRMLMDQAYRLTEGLQAMRVAREIQEERRQQELRILENNVQQDLNKAREDRRDFQQRLEERGEKFLRDRREEIRQFQFHVDEDGDNYSQRISDQVYRINGMLEEQRAARVEYGERISNSLEAEFQKVTEAIVTERNLRYEAQTTMERMVQDVCMRMRGEIQQEREQRENVQSKLLGLLEETCGRIESSFTGFGTSPAATGPHLAERAPIF